MSEYEYTLRVGHDYRPDRTYWVVQLPHQCDEYEVAYGHSLPEVVAEMQAFVSGAQEALKRLEATINDYGGELEAKGADVNKWFEVPLGGGE